MRSEADFLIEVVERLDQTGMAYMLTGSMASNYWGIPRTTHDLDFVLVLDLASVERFVLAFDPGFFVQSQSVRAALRPPYQFNVLDEQSALKADFWVLRDNSYEQAAFARRVVVELFGRRAPLATAEDLILHKLYWNQITPSDRQLQDAAGVFAVQAGALDLAYIRKWVDTLGVKQQLDDLLSGKLKPKST